MDDVTGRKAQQRETGIQHDPVCGMEVVPQAAAAERTLDGQRYVFCSKACVERFDADPLKYALHVQDQATGLGEERD